MSTTAQGNTYENKVLQLVKKLIADGTIAVGKHYSVHQKESYPIDFGTDSWKNRSRMGQRAGADWDTFDAAKLMIFSETVAF